MKPKKIKTKICCFANQKGGVGKSTLTSLIANYLHFNTDYKVCCIDADNNQRTLEEVRKRDIQVLGKDENIVYDLLSVDSINVPAVLEDLLNYPESEKYDYIFIDLPGNILQKGVFQTYFYVDYAFFPTDVTFNDISSLSKFLEIYQKEVVKKRHSAGFNTKIYGVLSKVKPNEIEFKDFLNNIESQPIPFMKNYIPETIVLKREITTAGEYTTKKFDNFENFCQEFLSITKN